MSAQEPSEEEMREALKQLRVGDVLLQTVVTLVNLTGRRLTAEGEKDLEQAREGIEAFARWCRSAPRIAPSAISRQCGTRPSGRR